MIDWDEVRVLAEKDAIYRYGSSVGPRLAYMTGVDAVIRLAKADEARQSVLDFGATRSVEDVLDDGAL